VPYLYVMSAIVCPCWRRRAAKHRLSRFVLLRLVILPVRTG